MMRWYALAAAVVALDQASKWTVLAQVEYGRSIPGAALPLLDHTCNTGVAFSMFQGYGSIFALVAVVVAAYLAFEIWRWRSGLAEGAAYGLILGGALGNLADRLQHGCVVISSTSTTAGSTSRFQRGRQRHHAGRCVLDRLRGDRINPRRSATQRERCLLILEPGYAVASSSVRWAIAALPLRPPPSPTRRGTTLWCSHFSDHRTRSQQALVRPLRVAHHDQPVGQGPYHLQVVADE